MGILVEVLSKRHLRGAFLGTLTLAVAQFQRLYKFNTSLHGGHAL